MTAIVKFKEVEDAIKFDQVIANFASWDASWKLKIPFNSKVEGCVRVLDIGETENDEALYEYLRDLGAFEEVALK